MSSVLCFGDALVTASWADALGVNGHEVSCISSLFTMQQRLLGSPVDIVIVNTENVDSGEAMLIPQARSAWPECRVIAVTSGYAFRKSAFYEMGLWSPDQLLLRPVNLRVLLATVGLLAAQIKARGIIEQARLQEAVITAKHTDDEGGPPPLAPH